MTLHPPKFARKNTPIPCRTRRLPPPLTLGGLLGAGVRAEQAKRKRRAELDAAGFRPLKGAE